MMKTSILTMLACLLLFTSCKKNGQPEPPDNTQRYPVRFDVSGFDQEITGFGKTTADTLSNHISNLYYVVFSGGNAVHKIEQVAGDENFGTIYDSLPAGSYTIALVGSKAPVTLRSYGLNEEPRLLVFPRTDVFYKRAVINVNGAVNQILVLDRIMSKLKIVLKDRVPYDAGTISVTPAVFPPPDPFSPTPLVAAFDLANGAMLPHGGPDDLLRYYPNPYTFTDAEKGMLNFTTEMYLLMPQTDTIAVQIKTTYTNGTNIAVKDIYNVRMETGKTTVLSGKAFDNPGSDSGVNVIINNPAWSGDSVLVNF